MLLRSASTPILGSLLPPSSPHTIPLHATPETLSDPVELPFPASASTPDPTRSLSLRRSSSHCNLASPGLSASISTGSDSASPTLSSPEDALVWNTDGDSVPRQVRRAQSETDLNKLSSLSSAALSVATCLVSREDEKECNGRKAKPALPLAKRGKQRSLSSVSSMCFGACGLDRQDFIPEEIEGSDMSSRGSVNNGSPEYSFGNQQVSGSKGLKVLGVIDGEVGVIERGSGAVGGGNSVSCSYGQEKIGHYLSNVRMNHESIMSQVMEREYSTQDGKGLGGAKPALEYGGGIGADGAGQGGGGGRRSIALLGNGGRGGAGSDSTEVYYQTMLKENPGHPLFLRNYAQYLTESKRDYAKAEEYYQRAILANPGDGELLAQFAKILWDVHQDKDRAASYFERAVQAAPDDSYVMAAYASFLWNLEADEEAEDEEGPSNPFSNFPALVSAGQA